MKVVMCTPAFANPLVMARTFDMIRATATENLPWLVLNQHYPLPSKHAYQCSLLELAEKHRFQLFDTGENVGLSAGYNFLINMLENDDIVIALDPDVLPATTGWDKALIDCFQDPRNVWASLANEISFGQIDERGYTTEISNGYKLRIPKTAVVNSMSAWRVSWLRSAGGIKEPRKYYGGLECCMWTKLDQVNKRWVFLQHYWEHKSEDLPPLVDNWYHAYKWAYATEGEERSFEEYLKANGVVVE